MKLSKGLRSGISAAVTVLGSGFVILALITDPNPRGNWGIAFIIAIALLLASGGTLILLERSKSRDRGTNK